MCLTAISDEGLSLEGVGYKNVLVSKFNRRQYVYLICHGYVPFNKPLRATQNDETADDGKEYKTGFHIFLNQKDAVNYGNGQVVEVRFKKGRVLGKQGDGTCVLADEITFKKVLKV